jgi:hypothetical protein
VKLKFASARMRTLCSRLAGVIPNRNSGADGVGGWRSMIEAILARMSGLGLLKKLLVGKMRFSLPGKYFARGRGNSSVVDRLMRSLTVILWAVRLLATSRRLSVRIFGIVASLRSDPPRTV